MKAALYLAGFAVGAFFGSGVGAWATTAVGRPILHVGLAIMTVGTTVLYVSLRAASDIGWLQLVPGMVVYGLGMGMIFVPLFSIIMGEIEDHEVGSASGLLESFQQLGASLGVAALATLFFATIRLEDGGPCRGDRRPARPGRRAHPARLGGADRRRLRRRVPAAEEGPRDGPRTNPLVTAPRILGAVTACDPR